MPDPELVRRSLLAAGASRGFSGMMIDRRYDRNGELLARDEVLRLRVFEEDGGASRARLGWKGPVSVTPEGYKARRELEYEVTGESAPPEAMLLALGFTEVQRIDRYVEYYRAGGADVRLEWYPRMDVLVEVEGPVESMEPALLATGLPRASFTPDALKAFSDRFQARTGTPPALSVAELRGAPPTWTSR